MEILKPSPRLPVLFLGHGSPMNAIEDNAWRRSWQALGTRFGADYPRPQLILCVSAHWLTRGWYLGAMDKPKTIHDFGGFPQALFDQQYPAPGFPAAAQEIRRLVQDPVLKLDTQEWGLDHGAWSVLKPMFPSADIPVMQLSMDYSRPASEHLAVGRQLSQLRDRGVLIVGSGNTVHNLRAMRRDAPDHQAYDWTVAFDNWVAQRILKGELAELADFASQGEAARLAQPSHEHYLPLLYAAGAAQPGEPVAFFNEGYQGASIAMRSVIWGDHHPGSRSG
jgi:4,5-DOPA dioxygenase extradiol